MLSQLASFLVASVVLTLTPGPDIIFVLSQSIVAGFKRGFMIALGLVTGIIFHTSLLAFGVSILLKSHPNLFFILKLLGATYLIYLAYQVWKSDEHISLKHQSEANRSFFKKGLIMNLINPKVSLFFLAFFPSFLWDTSLNTIFQFYCLGLVFMLQALLIFSLVAFFANRLSVYMRSNKDFGLWLKYFQILSFLLIALFILI